MQIFRFCYIFYLWLLFFHVEKSTVFAKGGRGGGGGGRGGGGSRSSGGSRGGIFSGLFGGSSGSGSHGSFSSSGRGSSFSSSRSKTVLSGLTGMYIGRKLSHGTTRMNLHGYNYYYGSRAYTAAAMGGSSAHNRVQCSFELESNEQLSYEDGYKVDKILFDCNAGQVCCDLECCSSFPGWAIFLICTAIVVVLFFACLAIKCKQIQWRKNAKAEEDDEKEDLNPYRSNYAAPPPYDRVEV